MTYRTRDGRQFVVVATGSGANAALVAFALPQKAVAPVAEVPPFRTNKLAGTSAAAFLPRAPKPPALPEGKGKALVATSCTQCHGLGNVTSTHLDRQGWDKVVSDMVDRGAILTDAQIATIEDYLARTFPKRPHQSKPSDKAKSG